MSYKYICYGCGKAKIWMSYLSLCPQCKIYKFFTGKHPNKLGEQSEEQKGDVNSND